MAASFDVSVQDGGVLVRGVSAADVARALEAYEKIQDLGGAARVVELVDGLGASANDVLVGALAGLRAATSPVTVRTVERVVTRREALLATSVLGLDDLARLRGQEPPTARSWFFRQQKLGKAFSVRDGGRRLVLPAFQFTESGGVRPELRPLISSLKHSGVDEWAIWHWLTSATGWLSGQVPEQVAVTDPDRAAKAARRFAARPAA